MLQNTTDFHTNLNPLKDISNPPCCDGSLLFRTFPKVEKRWTGLKYTNVAEEAANEVKKNNNKPKIRYLLNILPIWCLPCSRSISYKIHFFFVLFSFTLMHCLWLKRKILFVLVFQFILIIQLCLFSFERVDYILHGEFFVLWVFPVRGALPFLALSRACFSGNPLKDCKGLI